MDLKNKLEPSQQRKLEKFMMNSMIHDNMGMLNYMTQECFDQCVHEFPSKICDREEMSCIENCADRYLKLRLRVGQKFQYYQALKVQELKQKKQSQSS